MLTDRNGIPLACLSSAANIHDCKMLELLIDRVPAIHNGKPGRPCLRPEKLHADKGYDYEFCRELLKRRGIKPRIARRGIESSQKLGRYRWVIERTLAWLHQYRRLRIRWERTDQIHRAFLTIGCALICFRVLAK